MEALSYQHNFSLITVILPKSNAEDILQKSLPSSLHTDIIINARGTLYKEKWYQQFTPSVSPEQRILEMLVPNHLKDALMDQIAIACKLDENGIGAVYSIECEKTFFLKQYDFNQSVSKIEGEILQYKDNLFGIYCTAQRNTADEIATAAIRAGSVGPTVVFGQGRGIRDRLGLLRIAISPEKEMIRLVVDNYDTEPVFEAMIQEGRLDTPGMGFIYIIPIQKGIVNIPSTATAKNELASRHQMIKAIDEIQGGSAWRIQSEKGIKKQRKYLNDLKRLTCVVERGQGDALIQSAMHAGAPGASVTYGKESGGGQSRQGSSITVNRELEIIEIILSPDAVDTIITEMLNTAKLKKLTDLYFYTQPVPKALTYLG